MFALAFFIKLNHKSIYLTKQEYNNVTVFSIFLLNPVKANPRVIQRDISTFLFLNTTRHLVLGLKVI